MGMFFTQDNKPYFGIDENQSYELKTEVSVGPKIEVLTTPSALSPNVFYLFGRVSTTIKITRLLSRSKDYLETYAGEFTIDKGGSVKFPSSIRWVEKPNFSEVGYTYQFEIKNGIGRFIKVK